MKVVHNYEVCLCCMICVEYGMDGTELFLNPAEKLQVQDAINTIQSTNQEHLVVGKKICEYSSYRCDICKGNDCGARYEVVGMS